MVMFLGIMGGRRLDRTGQWRNQDPCFENLQKITTKSLPIISTVFYVDEFIFRG
jgi:hypothetical protein